MDNFFYLHFSFHNLLSGSKLGVPQVARALGDNILSNFHLIFESFFFMVKIPPNSNLN